MNKRKLDDTERIEMAIACNKIKIVNNQSAVRRYWSAAPENCEIVLPGLKGNCKYIINMRDSLKKRGFRFDQQAKLWFRMLVPEEEKPKGIFAFNLNGAIPVLAESK